MAHPRRVGSTGVLDASAAENAWFLAVPRAGRRETCARERIVPAGSDDVRNRALPDPAGRQASRSTNSAGWAGATGSTRYSHVMGALAGVTGQPSYASVHGPVSRGGGRFLGKIVTRTEHGDERLITNHSDTSWKAINDVLCVRRHQSEGIAAFIHEMSLRLEEAKEQKERQDMTRMNASFVILYKRSFRYELFVMLYKIEQTLGE